jgi:O-antigen/teichoic acid export membrane protein
MKDKLKKIITHPLISGSAIILLGTNLGNFFSFLYNLFMVRNLSSVDYGVLISMIAIITLFAYAADALTPFVVNFAAIFFAKNELGKAKSLFIKVTKAAILLGVSLLFAFFFLAPVIGRFLNVSDLTLVYIVGFSVFFGFLGIVNRAFLQAKMNFGYIAMIVFLGSFAKLSSGVFLVWQNFRVQGALMAFVIAFILPYVLSFIPLRYLFHQSIQKEQLELGRMIRYGCKAVFTMLGLTSFVTTDVLLVKHFFNPEAAGLYAGITIAGKIIFFFSAPVGSVMFPLIVKKYAQKKEFHNDFRLALLLVFVPSIILTIFYFFLPEFVIRFIMKREEYLAGVSYLGLIGLFFSIYSLTYVITNFFLSIQKTGIFMPILFFAMLQAMLIWFFHSSLSQVIIISILVSGLLLLTLLLYYIKISVEKKYEVLRSSTHFAQ